MTANEARARLTTAAAASTSLSQLHRYEPRLTAANQPVEEAVRVIRSQLGLPPPRPASVTGITALLMPRPARSAA